jgi:hypothetical protein
MYYISIAFYTCYFIPVIWYVSILYV